MSARSRRIWAHDDLSYSQWHRDFLPEQYERHGHRFAFGDRDWTESCQWCQEPLEISEMVRDVGQDLADKSTTWTRKLARRAGVDGWLFAYRTERPRAIQAQIDELSRRLRTLEAEWPIVGFRARQIAPRPELENSYTPEAWAKRVRDLHLRHWLNCPRAPWPRRPDGVKPSDETTIAGDAVGRVRLIY